MTAICANNSAGTKVEINGKITKELSEFKYLWSMISNCNTDCNLEYRIQRLIT